MATQHSGAPSPAETGVAAIRHLAQHGFERTTAGELADAMGMSRSTFFRRFGSKDDVVFADHDLALADLEVQLGTEAAAATPIESIARGAAGVLHLLTRDPAAAILRSELLRSTPSLRERELVITHRYERVFAAFLTRTAPSGTPEWVPLALAAGVVAVHNAALRKWLRDPDPRIVGTLDAELAQLGARFAPWFGGASQEVPVRVVVAAFDAGASPEAVLSAVRAQLSRPE